MTYADVLLRKVTRYKLWYNVALIFCSSIFITKTLIAMLTGNLIIYILGLTWLALFVGFKNVLQLGFYPFIPGDILKILLATFTLPVGWKILNKR